jgi:hypothetical protein
MVIACLAGWEGERLSQESWFDKLSVCREVNGMFNVTVRETFRVMRVWVRPSKCNGWSGRDLPNLN